MSEKFLFQSKTILSLVLSTVVLWAPQVGLDFSEEDAGFIMENLHELVVSGLAVFAGWGRFVADTRLRLGGGS